jgi:hypothetical protein
MTEVRGVAAVPPGTVLVHIGPQKTGTTAIQAALHGSRHALLDQGVRYAGPNRQSKQAARALTRSGPADAELTRHSRRLVNEVRDSASARMVVSAEAFADAEAAWIPAIVAALGGERVHVVVTLRPLARILPSQWQQFVQGGLKEPFDLFVARVLDNVPAVDGEPTSDWMVRRFWHRHRHDRLIARWLGVVGPARLTAVVLDEADRDGGAHAFEQLLGLRAGTLAVKRDGSNRSLTLAEAELVRELNAVLESQRISPVTRAAIVPWGVAEQLKARPTDGADPRITLPGWAHERIQGIAREIHAGIDALGVRVVGDADTLVQRAPPNRAASNPAAPNRSATGTAAWASVASAGAMGALIAAGLARESVPPGVEESMSGAAWPDDLATLDGRPVRDLSGISTPRIASIVAGRVRSLRSRLPAGLPPVERPVETQSPLPAPIHSVGVEEQ